MAACSRETTWALEASGAAWASMLAATPITATRTRGSGKRMQELREPLDLRRLEDAMAAIGRHDGIGVGTHRVRDHLADAIASQLAHARAFQARTEIRASGRAHALRQLVARDAAALVRAGVQRQRIGR